MLELKQRDFLIDKNILGAMLVSRCGDILNVSIPQILRWCDSLLLMYDNENKETKEIIEKHQKTYGDRIRITHSGFARSTKREEESSVGLFKRFNRLQGPIRQKLLDKIKDYIKAGEKIDIVVWLDSDEALTNNAREMLEFLIKRDDKKALILRPFFVFGDMRTMVNVGMASHLRIFKPSLEQNVEPYRGLCHIHPITKPEKQMFRWGFVHMCYLTINKRQWRANNWRDNISSTKENYLNTRLWQINKDAIEMTPDDVAAVYLRDEDITIEEYLKTNNLIL